MSLSSSQQGGKRASSGEVMTLWHRYKATGDKAHRNQLVLALSPLVKYIVFKKIRELPARCEVEDFVSCGLEALIASIDRYDPERGATLEQFVWTRIHGAVLDELRRLDWAPRSLRRWERQIARARDEFTTQHGRRPSSDELAQALGITMADLRRHEYNISMADTTTLNGWLHEGDSQIERIDTLPAGDQSLDPVHANAVREAKNKFRAAFNTLPPREKQVAILLYVKELTLRETGEIIGVSESRVCQIHAQMRRTLRECLAKDQQLLETVV